LLVIWDSTSGRLLKEIETPRANYMPQCLAISSQGDLAAYCCRERVVVMDLAQGKVKQSYDVPRVGFLGFTPQDDLVCSDLANTYICDVRRNKPRVVIPGVCRAPLAKDGRLYLFGQKGLERWNLNGDRQAILMDDLPAHAYAVASPDGALVAVLTYSESVTRIQFFSLDSKKEILTTTIPEAACFAFSPDSQHFAIGSYDAKIRLFHLASQQLVAELESDNSPGTVCFSANSEVLYWSDTTVVASRVRVRDARSWSSRQVPLACWDLAFCENQQLAVFSHGSSYVRLWDWQTAEPPKLLEGLVATPGKICMTPAPTRIALLAGASQQIAIYGSGGGKPLALFDSPDQMTPMRLSATGTTLAVGDDKSIAYISAESGKEYLREAHPFHDHWRQLSPDMGVLIGVSNAGDSVETWDLVTTTVLWRKELKAVRFVCFSESGDYLGVVTKDSARVVEICSGAEICKFDGIAGHTMAISPSLRWIAFNDGNVLNLKDVCLGKIWKGTEHGSPIYATAFDDRSQLIASGCAGARIRVWQVPQADRNHMTPGELELAWDCLTKEPDAAASAAARLVDVGDPAVELLKERLAKNGQRWISKSPVERDLAALNRLRLMNAASPNERQQRLTEHQQSEILKTGARHHELAPCRIIRVLGCIDTPAARSLLKELAQGSATDPLTCQAKMAWLRTNTPNTTIHHHPGKHDAK